MRNELESYVGRIIKFSGTITDFRNTDSDIDMDNNIIDDAIKYNNSPIAWTYSPNGRHMLRYKSYRTLLTNVTITAIIGMEKYHSFKIDHIWIIYDLRVIGYELNCYAENLFGKVIKYRRKNGSIDYGIYFI